MTTDHIRPDAGAGVGVAAAVRVAVGATVGRGTRGVAVGRTGCVIGPTAIQPTTTAKTATAVIATASRVRRIACLRAGRGVGRPTVGEERGIVDILAGRFDQPGTDGTSA
jgi:hypothetical protein